MITANSEEMPIKLLELVLMPRRWRKQLEFRRAGAWYRAIHYRHNDAGRGILDPPRVAGLLGTDAMRHFFGIDPRYSERLHN
jgi:hypothetical protein